MKLSVVSTVLTVFLFWLTTQIGVFHEEFLAYFFILTVGIIHGSNDISLINSIKQKKKFTSKYLLYYIGVILLIVSVFYVLPTLALLLFIFISCYHFGEQHFHCLIRRYTLLARGLYTCYGALIFAMLFYLNSGDTAAIIYDLTNYKISEDLLLGFLIVSFITTIIFFVLNIKNLESTTNYIHEGFLLLLFALLFKMAALLWAFAIYFVVWHSIPSLQDQIRSLYGETNRRNIFNYIKSSIIYWVISIFGLALLYMVTQYFNIQFITLFFAFLAAITVPHVIVMYFLYKD